ncbi:MAG TPA: HD domain-containing protein [Anaerolineae bacterium]|nr:HD domain-containing protein [Anaerolineae bacterium]
MPATRSLIPDSPLLRAALDACAVRNVRAWLVGGSVRDAILHRPIHDFDFAVERDAIETARTAADRLGAPMYVLDAERDTARVVVFDAGGVRVFLDFAGLREPGIDADLAQRDFTFNAMAVDLAQPDALIDPHGGRRDLEARLVRAVTGRSLADDPVRMLRAVRLSASLGFVIESSTGAQIRALASLIQSASAERVRDELAQIAGLPGMYRNLSLLDELGLLAEVMPELPALRGEAQSPPHHWDVFEHTLRMLDVLEILLSRVAGIESQAAPRPPVTTAPEWAWPDIDRALGSLKPALREHLEKTLSDDRPAWLALKWAAIFHDAAKPLTRSVDADGRIHNYEHEDLGAEITAGRMRALRFSNVEIERAAAIVRHHMRPHHLEKSGASRRAVYRFFRDLGEAGVDVLLHALADHLATHGPDLDPAHWSRQLELARALLDEYFRKREETVNPPALITGHDVMKALGLEPGPQVGKVLDAVREAQAAGEVKTREEALELARRVMRET